MFRYLFQVCYTNVICIFLIDVAFAISRAVKIPVMCASGLNDVTAPLALAAGARGVGIGSMVNKLPSSQQVNNSYQNMTIVIVNCVTIYIYHGVLTTYNMILIDDQ